MKILKNLNMRLFYVLLKNSYDAESDELIKVMTEAVNELNGAIIII